ncbi:DUF389 domain-containing protein [Luteimicrobium sp. NPDC057192]|uniref:DUF389 domain-containing protein n=1 Tax=Luteimicrobium sp. NPDC057192 TaxID=3346042 RepID=UPI00363E21CA
MHLRLVVPGELTERVVAQLRDDETVTDVVVLPGAAVDPPGDLVLADVAREAASEVIDRLVALGVPERGAVAVEEADAVLSRAADRAVAAAPGEPTDAVVWQQLRERAGAENRLSVTFLVLMAVACVIGMVGVVTNQPILVVGAMAVGPDFGPLSALAYGIVRRSGEMVVGGLRSTVLGYAAGMVGAILAAWVLRSWGLIDEHDLVARHALTDFVYQPGGLGAVVAFLAGVAGAVSLSTSRTGALVGVLISVTTIPAAGVIGAALAYGETAKAGEAGRQLVVNVAMIVVGAVVALLVQRGGQVLDERRLRSRRA